MLFLIQSEAIKENHLSVSLDKLSKVNFFRISNLLEYVCMYMCIHTLCAAEH